MDHTMEKELTMPKLRPEMEKGVLCAWLKEVNQIEATESGVLKKQLAEEGDTVDVAAPVAILETK